MGLNIDELSDGLLLRTQPRGLELLEVLLKIRAQTRDHSLGQRADKPQSGQDIHSFGSQRRELGSVRRSVALDRCSVPGHTDQMPTSAIGDMHALPELADRRLELSWQNID